MSDVNIVIGITGDTSGGRVIKKSLDDINDSAKKAVVGVGYFKNELASGQITIQKFTEKMNNAGQSAKDIEREVKRLGITQSGVNSIVRASVSPLERLQAEQAKYNKYLAAGAINQNTYAKATANNNAAIKRLNDEAARSNSMFGQAKGIVGGYIGARSAIEVVNIADSLAMVRGRVQNLTKDFNESRIALSSLRKTADDTGQSIESGLTVFSRLYRAKDEIEATNTQMLQFTDTVSKLGVISNTAPEALKNGLTQLGQAFSSEKIRAEEFNSVMENTPAIGEEIAKQFGISQGALGALVRTGKVDSKDIFTAILASAKEVNEQLEKMPLTASRGFKEMTNDLGLVVDQINQGTGGTSLLGKMFQGVGEIVKSLYVGITTLFDYILAAIGEFGNKIDTLQNKGRSFANRFLPGSMQLSLEDTVDSGSYFGAAREAMIARQSAVFMDNSSMRDVGPTDKEKEELKEKYRKLTEAAKAAEKAKEALRAQKKIQDELTDAIKDSRTETEKLYDRIAEMERLKPFAKTNEQSNAIAKNIKNARDELDKLAVEAELNSPMGRAFQSLASEIDDGFKDAFKSAFTESDGGFKALLNGWKNTFKSFLADLAYQAFARPIVISLVGAVGGAFGLSSGAIASAASTGGNIGTTVGSGNMFSGLSSLLGSGYSNTLGGIGGKIGSGLGLNFGQTAKLQQVFGNSAYGGLGSLGAQLLGLGSGNMIVDSGLGIGGSLIGSAFGGPIGAGIGGFIGSALGGMFGGGKPSDKAQGGYIDLASLATSTSGMTGKKFSQENANFRDAVLNEISSLASLMKDVGGQVNGAFGFTIGSRDGLRIEGGQNYGNNTEAFLNAVKQLVVQSTSGLNATFQTILNKVGVGNTAALSDAFAFGKSYEATLNPVSLAEQLTKAIADLNVQFSDMIKRATDLGLPIEEYTKALDKQKEAAIGALKAQAAGFSSLEEMTKTFKSFLDGQALGTNSSLNPMDKLALAQSNFDTLLKTVQGGDVSVTSDLLSAANTLLEVSRGVYASSVSFAGMESFVRTSITDIARAAGVPGYAVGTNSAAPGLAMVGERGRELVRMGGGEQVFTAGQTAGIMALSGNAGADIVRTNQQVIASNQENTEKQEQNRKELVKMRKVMERLMNYMKVAA